MKRSAAIILAAAMLLSLAGCADSKPDSDISAAPQVTSGRGGPESSDPYAEPASLEMTDGQEMVELLKYNDFYYTAQTEVRDEEKQLYTVYEGVLEDDAADQKLYDMLCGFIKNSEITFEEDLNPMLGRPLLKMVRTHTKHYTYYTLYCGTVMQQDEEKNIYVLSGPNSSHYLDPSEQDKQTFEQLIKKAVEKPENITKESGGERLTPAPTTIDDLVNYRITSFEYSAKVIKENREAERRSYYEGKIDNFTVKKEIFNTICKFIKTRRIDDDDVEKKLPTGHRCTIENKPVVTLTNIDGGEFKLYKGTLPAPSSNSSPQPVWVIISPNGKRNYFTYDEQDAKLLTEVVQQGVCIRKNFIRDEYSGNKTPDPSKKLTANDLAYISVRTNYAEGTHIAGYYVSKKGNVYNFNFSEIESEKDLPFQQWLIRQIEIHSQTADAMRTIDVKTINKGLGYAAKIDPNAKVTTENKMFDYGQNTAYAIVDGKFVMLWSKGDNDCKVEDKNADKAAEAFNEALSVLNECDD